MQLWLSTSLGSTIGFACRLGLGALSRLGCEAGGRGQFMVAAAGRPPRGSAAPGRGGMPDPANLLSHPSPAELPAERLQGGAGLRGEVQAVGVPGLPLLARQNRKTTAIPWPGQALRRTNKTRQMPPFKVQTMWAFLWKKTGARRVTSDCLFGELVCRMTTRQTTPPSAQDGG